MKIKHLLTAVAITCSIASAPAIQAARLASTPVAPKFQAGNITDGTPVQVTDTSGLASYYADGTSGVIKFKCDVQPISGEKADPKAPQVLAKLTPGKNFNNEYNKSIFLLRQGTTEFFYWRLTPEGDATNGNIKIAKLKFAKDINVQCKGAPIEE
jgi:hypothetical protein